MSIHKIKLSKEELYPVYISIFLAVVGYIISMYTNANVFPRFGALIVCVGVLFSIKALSAQLDHAVPIFKSRMNIVREELDKIPDCDKKESLKAEITEEEYKQSRTVFALKKRLFKIEGGIIIAGTLIWGFGECFATNCFLVEKCF